MLDNKNDSFENTKKYKKTAIGIIPNEWTAKTFDEIALKSNKKYNPLTDNNDCKCIELEHIQQQTGILLGYCSAKKQASIKNTFSVNDVLYSKLRPYLRKFYFANFNGVCSSEIWVLKPQSEITNKYLFYIVQSDRFNSVCNGSCIGSKMPRADYDYISQYLFAVPPLEEQQKIAEILSTQDKVIELKEKLIAEKQRQKKYLMQQLLTGKMRLKGFSGEWKKIMISDVGEVITGSTPSRKEDELWGKGFAWISAKDFKNKYINSTAEEVTEQGIQQCRKLPKGAVLVTCIASIGLNAIANIECATNQQINAIICDEAYNNEFIFYIIDNMTAYIKKLAGTTAVPIISKQQFENIKIKIPVNIDEQTAIAEILSITDQEIELLQKEMEQEKQKKKALMQLLLTGIVRV